MILCLSGLNGNWKHSEKNWYEKNIEESIRPIVRLLRDNGINTISSCGHMMYCQCECYFDILTTVYSLLLHNGYQRFRINIETEVDMTRCRSFQNFNIWFPQEDGTYHKGARAVLDQMPFIDKVKVSANESSVTETSV